MQEKSLKAKLCKMWHHVNTVQRVGLRSQCVCTFGDVNRKSIHCPQFAVQYLMEIIHFWSYKKCPHAYEYAEN